jgi:erythromycin esterase-like protein
MPVKEVQFEDQVEQFNVKLSWEPDKYVNLGIQTADGRSLADWLRHNDQDGSAQFTGLFGTLDRPSLNRLIRLLRTARDDVFGRDA